MPEIINVLVSEFVWPKKWDYSATVKTANRECRGRGWGETSFSRAGTDSVRVLRSWRYYQPPRKGKNYQTLKVTEPILRYFTTINVCDEPGNRQYQGFCDSIVQHEIVVVSKRLVKVNQKVLRGGSGAGAATGDIFSCTYRKK